MAIGTSLRASLASRVPTWLGNVPGLRNLYSVLYTLALLGDCLREIALEGQFAAYPGVGTPTALPYIAASRGLVEGPTESDALFAARLIAFRSGASQMGSPAQLALEIQAFLVGQGSLGAGVYPVVRIVDRSGNTTTAAANRTISYGTVIWTWDTSGGWVDAVAYRGVYVVDTYWSDIWILITDPYTHYTSFSDANWLAAFNSGDQTIDSLCPQAVVNGVLSIAETWSGAHTYVRNIAWVPDPTAFVPSGYYGNASRNVSGTQTAQRTVTNSYWASLDGA